MPARNPPHPRLWEPLGKGGATLCNRRSTAVPIGSPRPSIQHHSPGGGPGDCDLQLPCAGIGGFLAGATRYTTRRRSDPPWGTHGPGGVRFPYFFSLHGRSPVSHPTCEVPFPPRRSCEYRKGMIPARPLYQGGCGSVGDPELSKELVGDWGSCVAETRATRPNGEWGYSTCCKCWATSAQRRCHPEEALYLPIFSHLFDCQ